MKETKLHYETVTLLLKETLGTQMAERKILSQIRMDNARF